MVRRRTDTMLVTRVVVGDEARRRQPDELIVEEPMTIQLDGNQVTTTMRTPGHDYELAAGFCHTLTSSAKPVALFAETDGQANYEPRDLLRLSLWLGPANAAVVLLFSFFVWPLMGLPLFPSH